MFYTFFNKSFSFELETLTRKVFTKDITLSKNLIVFDSKKFDKRKYHYVCNSWNIQTRISRKYGSVSSDYG